MRHIKCNKCKGTGKVQLLGLYLETKNKDNMVTCLKCGGIGKIEKY